MRKFITTLLLSIVFSTPSIATEFSEVWKCKDTFDHDEEKVIVTAKVNKSLVNGQIIVSGITHETRYGVEDFEHTTEYYVQGFNRRWDFGDENQYSFLIKPNGDGHYYVFKDNEVTKPTMFMKCWQKEREDTELKKIANQPPAKNWN